MATTKWENFKLYNGPSNTIYIGKKDAKETLPGITLYSDKSDDRTDECVKVVMQHMNGSVEEGESALNYRIPGYGTLTWTPEPKEETE